MKKTTVVLGDMIELTDDVWGKDLHVGLVPCIVNNQSDISFNFEDFVSRLRDSWFAKPRIS